MTWLKKNAPILALIALLLTLIGLIWAWQNRMEAKFDALSREVGALQRQAAYNTGVLDTMRRAALAVQPGASEYSAEDWIEQWATLPSAAVEAPPAVEAP